ncbi:hypothetical protein D3C76_1696030 [compost metagenome]
MISRLFCRQFLMTAKAITHRRRFKAVAAGANQVVLAVTDHQRLRRVQRFLSQQMGNQFDLIGTSTVEFAAVDHLEVVIELEMAGNFAGELPGF